MDIKSLGAYINISDIPDEWSIYYDEALQVFNENWLDIDFEEIFAFYELDSKFKERFLKEIERLKKDINLNYLVYLWYYILYLAKNNYKIQRWKIDYV